MNKAEEYLKLWNVEETRDERIEKFVNTYDSWFKQFEENEQILISELLNNFKYYTRSYVNGQLKKLNQDLNKMNTNINIDNTVYTHLNKDNGLHNSSNEYLLEFKTINNINKYTIQQNFSEIQGLEEIENIVIIDDFTGSGDSLEKFINKYAEELNDKNIYFITIHSVQKALTKLADMEYRIECLSGNSNDQYFTNEDKKNEFRELSKKKGINKKYIFGYKESQSLVAFYNNTPNNTMGVFWMKKNNYDPIFEREKDEKPSRLQMKNDKCQRNNDNYIRKVKSNEF